MSSALDAFSSKAVMGGPDDRMGTHPTIQAALGREATAQRIQSTFSEDLMRSTLGNQAAGITGVGRAVDVLA